MSRTDTTAAEQSPRRGDFTTTSWTAIITAQRGGCSEADAALEALCVRYWYPIYAHARRRGHSSHEAEDLTQEFFYKILKENFLGAANRTRGRFRSFLLAALDNFLNSELKRARALKRGGGHTIPSLDAEEGEARYSLEPADQRSPEKLFARRWFLSLHEGVLERLREEAAAAGKENVFNHLKVFLTGDTEFGDYAPLAQKLRMTTNAVAVAVHRLRHRCQELWRAEIGQTVTAPREIEDELRRLLAELAS